MTLSRRSAGLGALIAVTCALTACTPRDRPDDSAAAPEVTASRGHETGTTAPGGPGTGTGTTTPGATTASGTVAPGTAGWQITVYYTAVESFHHGSTKQVTGCPVLNCSHGGDDLGEYPGDFVTAVHDEGAGRITGGEHAGKYLNWSSGTGYWLDTAPRDTTGQTLTPFVSAAADDLQRGTRFRVTGCGHQEDGSAVPADICRRLTAPRWEIRDAFTPGLGGPRHIDLYIGEETTEKFTAQPIYTTLVNATVAVGQG